METKHLKNSFLALCTFIFLGLFFLTAKNIYFSDSEIWLITLSQRAFNVGDLVTIYYKWGFHTLIYTFTYFASSEWSIYIWSRLATATIAVSSLFITARTFTLTFQKKQLLLPLVVFLGSTSIFFARGFNVRADIYSYFFHACALYLIFTSAYKKPSSKNYFLLFIINLLLLSTGPKMIYMFLSQFLTGWWLARQNKNKDYFHWILFAHLMCIIAILLVCILSYYIPTLPNLPLAISLGLDFFFNRFIATSKTPDPWSFSSFWYLTQFITVNRLHMLIATIAVSSLIPWAQKKSLPLTPSQKAMGVYVFSMTLGLLIHNDKLPFFIAPMLLPVLSFTFLRTFSVLEKLFPRHFLKFLFLTIALLVGQSWREYLLYTTHNNNHKQAEAVKTLEKYYQEHPDLRVYDVIGITPRLNKVFAFTGPGEENQTDNILKNMINQKPNMVLYTFKCSFLEPQLRYFLESQMIEISPGVWAQGDQISLADRPELFQRVTLLDQKPYWVLPKPNRAYAYDLITGQNLTPELIYLSKDLKKTSSSQSENIAIPQSSIAIGFSDYPPLQPAFSPYELFRFDTGF